MKYFQALDEAINAQLEAFLEFAHTFIDLDIVAVYVLGSHTDNTAVATSDLDIAIVHKTTNEDYIDEVTKFFETHSRNFFKSEIDLYLVSLDQINALDKSKLLTREGIINIKLASRLLYGKDIRPKINVPDLNDYIQITLQTPLHFMKKLRGLTEGELTEIEYPNKHDYYYGYLEHASETHKGLETKPLLTLIGWIGTSLIALKAGKLIGKKSDVVKLYTRYVNDEWTDYINNAYDVIRNHLAYRSPMSVGERKAVREICEQLLAYEKYYLSEYEKY